MMIKHLEVGSVLAATFIDGIEETPHVVGTLKLDDERGVRVFIPFVQGSKEFESVEAWFDGQNPPPHLSVIGNDLRIGLFGCGFSGLTSNTPHGTAEGHIDAEEAVLKERDGEFSDPLRVKEVTSEIDGLYEWARLKSVTTDHSTEGDGWSLTNTLVFTVKAAQGLVWRQGDATLSVSTTFNASSGRGINLEEKAVLRSAFDLPRSFREHLAEQRKFVTFLSLMFGTSLSFRGHRVRDDRYTTKTMGGQIMDYPHVELISRQTIREYSKPLPPKKELDHPLVRMPNLQSESLSRWSDNYDQWERFILPISGVYRVPTSMSFVENIALNSAMSLEALGAVLVGYVEGEEATYQDGKKTVEFATKMKDPTTPKKVSSRWKTVATDIYRGIKPLGLNWTQIAASEIGLARAVANNYNTLKHPSKGSFPDPLHTRLLSDISSGIVRLNALKLVTDDEGLIKRSQSTHLFRRTLSIFADERLFISDNGEIVSLDPEAPTAD